MVTSTTDLTAYRDPAPLSFRQVRSLGVATVRELAWGLRYVDREVNRWRALAKTIPDPILRADALESLAAKRTLVEGAARFWSIPARRNRQLLRALVTFQVMADYLDTRSEVTARHRGGGIGSMMEAYVDAVDIDRPVSDYYRDHPGSDDGGYLRTLVTTCRACCASLPRYPEAHQLLAAHARFARSLDIQHDADVARRTRVLGTFVSDEMGGGTAQMPWFEKAAAACSAIVVLGLLPLAAEPSTTAEDLRHAESAYTWIATLSMMLDSYADQHDDAAAEHISFVAFYPDAESAVERMCDLIDCSTREALSLRNGERHAVIVCMMVAMFLSRDAARGEELAAGTREMLRAGGSLTQRLAPVLRFWRVAYRQQAK